MLDLLASEPHLILFLGRVRFPQGPKYDAFWLHVSIRIWLGQSPLPYHFFSFTQIPSQSWSNRFSPRIGSNKGSIGKPISQKSCSSTAVRRLFIACSRLPIPA